MARPLRAVIDRGLQQIVDLLADPIYHITQKFYPYLKKFIFYVRKKSWIQAVFVLHFDNINLILKNYECGLSNKLIF